MRLQISQVYMVEGDLYNVMGEDEMLFCYDCVVEAIVDGDIYHHNHVFRGAGRNPENGCFYPNRNCKAEAQELANRVAARGSINLTHWELVGNLSEQDDPMDRLEREWSDNSDHFECFENYVTGR